MKHRLLMMAMVGLFGAGIVWGEDWPQFDGPGRISHNGSRAVPTVGEKGIFAVGPFGHVYGFDRAGHKLLWHVDMVGEYQGEQPNWGFSQSPLLYGDMLIAAPMGEAVGMIALDQATGTLVWKTAGMGGESYTSPMLHTIEGTEGILFITQNQVSFVEPKTGMMIWTYDGYFCEHPIPYPTSLGDGRLFVTGGYRAGSVMTRVAKSGEVFEVSKLFRLRKYGSQIHAARYYQGFLYANFNRLTCFDPEGHPRWVSDEGVSFALGSLIIADDMIYILDSGSGELALVEAKSEGYRELARANIFEGGRRSEIFGPLALSGGKLILRDQEKMTCLDVRAQ